jgi:hypothetical protein
LELELGRDLVVVEELAPVDRDLVVIVLVPLDPAWSWSDASRYTGH